jgi:hypothetical protein
MMNFNKYIGGGASLAISALILSATLSAAPAQAFSLNGSIKLSGTATLAKPNQVSPATDTIKFLTSLVDNTTTGSFASLIGTSAVISDVNLIKAGPSVPLGPSFSATPYTATTVNPFIQFQNGLKFDINNPFNVLRASGGGFKVAASQGFSGIFYGNGVALGNGIFTVNVLNTQGSYSATIAAVPEPLTIFGSSMALGFAAFLKRKRAQKQKQATVSA